MGQNNSKNENDKTKQYKIEPSNRSKKKAKKDNKKGKKKHSKLKKAILILFLLVLLVGGAGIGAVAGIFFSDKWEIAKDDLTIKQQNSQIYDSKDKYLGELVGDESRKVIPLSEMGEYLPKAFVAIEDERFEEHSGIDIKRTVGATVQFIVKRGTSSYGGSTITQQLVKNLMKEDEDTGVAGMERKIREMSRAYQIEKMLSKNQILELYLNLIFMGGTVYGVENGSQYYFAKSAKDLSLAQAAFLAGINDGPNLYNPYDSENDHKEKIEWKTKVVLDKMKELGKITDEEYTKAIEEVNKGFKFKKGKALTTSSLSYHAKAAVDEVVADLAETRKISEEAARTLLYSGGYKVYTTQDSSIQKTMETEMAKTTYKYTTTETIKDKKGKSQKVKYETQAGMVIIEPSSGKVVATVGNLGKGADSNNFNYAIDARRQPGSSIKPIADVAPGLEEKVITAATIYNDVKTEFEYFNGGIKYHPNNADTYRGLITVRRAIGVSSNVVNIKIMANVGPETCIKYLNEFGLTQFTKKDTGLATAIGGTQGASPLQMAAAYATIANKGKYIEPTFYRKVVDSNKNTILEPKQEKRRVISEANAYILTDILREPVIGSGGTASRCTISGMQVAAKTGTSDNAKDKWLCGFTPYYAAAVWYGYGGIEKQVPNYYAAQYIWRNVMREVHEDLKNANFTKPDSVVSAKVCKTTGNIANASCTSTYNEYFVKGQLPKECEGHSTVEVCKESKLLATEFCPEKDKISTGGIPEKEASAKWKPYNGSKISNSKIPTEKCNIHTAEKSQVKVVNVIGKTETEARSLLTGLTIQVISAYDSTKPEGTVLKQSLAENTSVLKGTAIVITINKNQSTSIPNTNTPGTTPGGNTTNTTNPGGTTTPNNGVNSGGTTTPGTTTPNTGNTSGGTTAGGTTTPNAGGTAISTP